MCVCARALPLNADDSLSASRREIIASPRQRRRVKVQASSSGWLSFLKMSTGRKHLETPLNPGKSLQ